MPGIKLIAHYLTPAERAAAKKGIPNIFKTRHKYDRRLLFGLFKRK